MFLLGFWTVWWWVITHSKKVKILKMKKKMFDNIKMARINFFWITWNHDMWFLRIVFDKYESKLFDESMNKKNCVRES